MSRINRFVYIFILGAFFIYNCATTSKQPSSQQYQQEIEKLKGILIQNPKDEQALQQLGIIYYRLNQFYDSRKTLAKAFMINPNDGKTMTYLGLALEAENKNKIALKVYKRYTRVSRTSSYRTKMEMRYRLLQRKLIQDEMRALLDQEQNLGTANLSPQTIAVFPFSYKGADNRYSSLSKGLSEMIITDLSQVPELQIVERVRVQALFDEIGLGQTGMVEESSAPRFGKLLGAGKLIIGDLNVTKDENLDLSVAFWDVMKKEFPDFSDQNDQLDNMFKLEKDIVFQVIDGMGIELTPELKEQIQFIPTKNMQAFLAYSMALDKEDAGDFEKAIQFYQLSTKLDPNFGLAGQKLEESKAFLQAEKLDKFDNPDHDKLKADQSSPQENQLLDDLISNRLEQLNLNIGSNFIPGQENRKSIEEAQSVGIDVFEDLPLPPDPPNREPAK
jgi:tetratricopeptide (TPR) repeat protein